MNLEAADRSLFFLINKGFNHGVLDALMVFFSKNYEYVLLGTVLLLFIYEKERKNVLMALFAALAAFALADWAGNSLKELFARPRPCQALDVRLLIGCGSAFSMPSNHAANAFALVIPFPMLVRSRLTGLMCLTAALVAVSRIYVGVHYPSDVLAGAFLGIIMGTGMAQLSARVFEKGRKAPLLFFFLFAVTLFRYYFILNGGLQLTADEAHYWEWSRRLDYGYYSKGPVVAYLIRAGTFLFGNTELGVRFFAPILSLLGSVLLFKIGKLLHDEDTGFYSAIIFQMVPLFSAFGIIMTIDAPLLFFWILSLLLFYRALSIGSISEWLLLGLAAGLGLLTKFTMGFFYISALLYLLFTKEDRRELVSVRPYAGALFSLIVLLPLLFWNMEHDFVMFKHNIGHTHIDDGFRLSGEDFFEFIGSQIGVLTPILFFMIIYALMRQAKKDRFSFWFAMPTLLFFLIKSIQGKVEANWAMPGYITGIIAFSAYYMKDFKYSKPVIKVLVSLALLMGLALTAVSHYPRLLQLPPDLDPSAKLRGWKEAAEKVDGIRAKLDDKNWFILSDSYQLASELAFYLKGQPVTYCVNLGRRMNQYDLWPGFHGFKKKNAIFVRIGDSEMPEKLAGAFARFERKSFTVYEGSRPLRNYTVFLCYGFKGMEKGGARSY